MWTKAMSVGLSLFCTRALIFVTVLAAVALPFWVTLSEGVRYGEKPGVDLLYFSVSPEMLATLLVCAYACFAPALVALLLLQRMLKNIRAGLVFVRENVGGLRGISWCCFAVAAVMLYGWLSISFVSVFVVCAAAFFGLLMRVVKNVIDAACEIKDENDLTV